ncbi:MAG TPA: phage holin family protein [Candidatus Acidoferrum sp.]|nr:phage holin family protein [Candidatus Acidoferrum sp.]
MDFGITGVAGITVICYLVGMGVKAAGSEKLNKWIPTICGGLGGLLGIVGLIIMPEFPATDYITAAAVGVVSGFAATGVNQVVKQLGSQCQ